MIKVWQIVECANRSIEDDINNILEAHQHWEVVDIKFAIMPDRDGGAYHEALIIYRESGESHG